MPRSGEHTLYYSDKFCCANPKDIVHPLTNSALPIPRTLCILFWQILQCQSQGHCTYYSDRSPSANPKDILYTTPASQGHCAYANSPVPITKDFVHTSLTNSPMPIPRTLCLRKLSSANPKDTVCTLLWQILWCQSQGLCAHYLDNVCSANPKDIVLTQIL